MQFCNFNITKINKETLYCNFEYFTIKYQFKLRDPGKIAINI